MRPKERKKKKRMGKHFFFSKSKAISQQSLKKNKTKKTDLPKGVECVTVADVGGIWTLAACRGSGGV